MKEIYCSLSFAHTDDPPDLKKKKKIDGVLEVLKHFFIVTMLKVTDAKVDL